MPSFSCRTLWTGSGPSLSNAMVQVDDFGKISSIDTCSTSSDFDYSFAMPAFVDAHVHLSWMLVKEASLDLSSAGSKEELCSLVRSAIPSRQEPIVRGESFDESLWTAPLFPSLFELDSLTGEVPVFLRRVCGHTALANTAMMRLLPNDLPGVNRSTGVLKEWPVMNFDHLFPLPEKLLVDAVSKVESKIFSMGVTAVNSFESIHTAELVQHYCGKLFLSIAVSAEKPQELQSLSIKPKTVKIFLDGSFGARTAALEYPYQDNSIGDLLYSDQQLLELFLRFGEAGFSVAAHAIGGVALRQLDRVSNSAFRNLGHGFTVRVEHAEDLLNAWPGSWNPEFHLFSMQPNFVERWQQPGGLYDRILPSGKSLQLNPLKTVLDAGFRLGFGSDCMPLNPIYGLHGATSHRSDRESLTTQEALSAYTLGAASISGIDQLAYPLARGRRADLVFLSANPFNGLEDITVEATMSNGKIVYDNRIYSGRT